MAELMSDFLEACGSLFEFLFDQLGNFANFFTSNTLGIIILGLILFSVITSLLTYVINRFK